MACEPFLEIRKALLEVDRDVNVNIMEWKVRGLLRFAKSMGVFNSFSYTWINLQSGKEK